MRLEDPAASQVAGQPNIIVNTHSVLVANIGRAPPTTFA
jgi:hypothetical protein